MQLSGMSIALVGAVFASGPEIKAGMTIRPLVYAVIAAFGLVAQLLLLPKDQVQVQL